MFDGLMTRISSTLGTALGRAIEMEVVLWMVAISIAALVAWIAFMATQPIVRYVLYRLHVLFASLRSAALGRICRQNRHFCIVVAVVAANGS